MGQKASSYLLRLGINQSWQSNYFPAKSEQANWLKQDKLIRNYLFSSFPEIIQVRIERTTTELLIFIHSPNVSLITGENNDNLDQVLSQISGIVNEKKITTKLHLVEERKIYSSAQAIANDLARKLESRIPWRLVQKDLLRKIAQERVQGIKIFVQGRIDGAEIAKKKKLFKAKCLPVLLMLIFKKRKLKLKLIMGKLASKLKSTKVKKRKK